VSSWIESAVDFVYIPVQHVRCTCTVYLYSVLIQCTCTVYWYAWTISAC